MLDIIRKSLYGRKHPRVMADEQAPVTLTITALGRRYETTALDLSESGASFTLPVVLPTSSVGTPVSLDITLPEPSAFQFKVVAELRCIDGYTHGIEFYDLEREYRRRIAAYVAYIKKHKPELLMKNYSAEQGKKTLAQGAH